MAEMEQGDRTEPASPRKREDARKKGQIANSPDLTSALVFVSALLALAYFGSMLMESQLNFMRGWLGSLDGQSNLAEGPAHRFSQLALPIAGAACAILVTIDFAALSVGALQAGFGFNLEILELKWERVNPIEGFKRLFSLASVVTTLLGLAKLGVVFWAAYSVVSGLIEIGPLFWQLSASALLDQTGRWIMQLGWTTALPMLVLGAFEYGFKRWKFEKELMMTRDEVREENRQQEGDPHVKQRVRQIQRQRAMRRMMKNVPKATVVITNPTHVAIALMYDSARSPAPVVVAKGEHLVAQRIKAIAAEHGVPVIEEPPLARALLRTTEIGQQIPIEFYRAVAEILAALYRRKTPLPRMQAAPSAGNGRIQ